ncbi:hypothetical protein DFH07DRAFT_768085 [Mycena maculata]|uniref:Uncharacterized protein n=1 Tax=Mycena maculata TaxID=230809 RepID=A0AAD7JU91_9AGAR|nr:hypothetical protein DFH07DRAFT_768085 [Mycena maculata]
MIGLVIGAKLRMSLHGPGTEINWGCCRVRVPNDRVGVWTYQQERIFVAQDESTEFGADYYAIWDHQNDWCTQIAAAELLNPKFNVIKWYLKYCEHRLPLPEPAETGFGFLEWEVPLAPSTTRVTAKKGKTTGTWLLRCILVGATDHLSKLVHTAQAARQTGPGERCSVDVFIGDHGGVGVLIISTARSAWSIQCRDRSQAAANAAGERDVGETMLAHAAGRTASGRLAWAEVVRVVQISVLVTASPRAPAEAEVSGHGKIKIKRRLAKRQKTESMAAAPRAELETVVLIVVGEGPPRRAGKDAEEVGEDVQSVDVASEGIRVVSAVECEVEVAKVNDGHAPSSRTFPTGILKLGIWYGMKNKIGADLADRHGLMGKKPANRTGTSFSPLISFNWSSNIDFPGLQMYKNNYRVIQLATLESTMQKLSHFRVLSKFLSLNFDQFEAIEFESV